MLKRLIDSEFDLFFDRNGKEALLVDGARQVGKTFSIRAFGKRHFENVVEINFIKDKKAREIFENVASETDVLVRISAMPDVRLVPGKTLIFFDEIQECPEAVTFIKFLVDEGSYRYVLSGSLLGVELKDVRSVPVGYLREVKMFPLSFKEFAWAMGVPQDIIGRLEKCWRDEKPVDHVIHERMKTLFRLYLVVGGMPAAVQTYIDTKNITEVVKVQRGIIVEYRKDATKYAKKLKLGILRVLDLIPEELNKKNRRFFVADLKSGSRYEREEDNFIWLTEAGIALPCPVSTEAKVPLRLSQKSNFFKLFLNDVGLLAAMYMDGIQFRILSGETEINNGSVYENFIAQELTANGFTLRYYNSVETGEVDFLIEKDGSVLPIEVKSGRHYRSHAALDRLLEKNGDSIPAAKVLSNANTARDGNIVYQPIYLAMFLSRDEMPSCLRFEPPSFEDCSGKTTHG